MRKKREKRGSAKGKRREESGGEQLRGQAPSTDDQ